VVPAASAEPEPDPLPQREPSPESDPPPKADPPPGLEPEPPIHKAGAAGRLLEAAGDFEAHVAQARAQLDALEDALGRLERYDAPAE
jgi:hypothetical protein